MVVGKKKAPTASEVFAHQVREVRQKKGWSQRDLLDALQERYGVEMNPATIHRIETDLNRRVPLDEALLLAAVLDVAPIELFLPLDGVSPVEVAPGLVLDGQEARRWAGGRDIYSNADDEQRRFYAGVKSAVEREASDRHMEAWAEYMRLRERYEDATRAEQEAMADELLEARERATEAENDYWEVRGP